MSLEELERRLQVLEDVEAIRKLKARYSQVLDGFSKENVETLFTEDGVWDLDQRGRFVGRQAIKEFSKKLPEALPFCVHYFVQPTIVVEGQRAKGRWYMLVPATKGDGGAIWSAGLEDDEYEKVNGEWLISKLKLTSIFRTPYEEGWHKKRQVL